jgi:hypothetical protein
LNGYLNRNSSRINLQVRKGCSAPAVLKRIQHQITKLNHLILT